MKPIKLTTGETIGGWSMDMVDGRRDDSLPPALPSDAAGPSSGDFIDRSAEAAEADSFANRMMENLYYQKMKAKLKQEKQQQQEAEQGQKKKKKTKAAPAPPPPPSAVPEAIPTAMVKDKGGEISCSVAETNRIRAELGLKPLAGTVAPAPAPAANEPPPVTADDGPVLGPSMPDQGAVPPPTDGTAAPKRPRPDKVDEAEGAKQVMTLALDQWTTARPKW